MRKVNLLFIILIFFFKNSQALNSITIIENTLKVAGLSEDVFYYGFAEGDQIIFNFEEINGKEMKSIEIIELPSLAMFTDYKSKKIANKIFEISRSGIFCFRLTNSSLSGRICKIKLQRIPKTELTRNFNCSVFRRTIQDTSYTPTLKKYLIKSDTSIINVYDGNTQISSRNALNGNKNYLTVNFTLPINTISWSFYIGTGLEGKSELTRSRNEFSKSASATLLNIPNYGPLAVLALNGVSYFNSLQGENNVKYWFMGDFKNVELFESRLEHGSFKKGDVVTEAAQMQKRNGKVYLGLLNDNHVDPIQVLVKIVAVNVKQVWGEKTVQVMNVTNKEDLYLKN